VTVDVGLFSEVDAASALLAVVLAGFVGEFRQLVGLAVGKLTKSGSWVVPPFRFDEI